MWCFNFMYYLNMLLISLLFFGASGFSKLYVFSRVSLCLHMLWVSVVFMACLVFSQWLF